MNSPNSIERSWWRRLARRKRAEAARTNRLSHFEPLEQRTVLSAGFGMGDDFWHNPHPNHSGYDAGGEAIVVAHGQSFESFHDQGLHLGSTKHEEVTYRDPVYAPPSVSLEPTLIGQPLREFQSEPSHTSASTTYSALTGEGENLSSTPVLLGPQLGSTASYIEGASSYKVEVVIVHDDAPYASSAAAIVFATPAPARLPIYTPAYVSAVDNGVFASLYAAAMQRRIEPPPTSYPAGSRLGSLNAMSEDAGSATGKSLDSTLQSTSASLLATLGAGSSVNLAGTAHISMGDDEGGSSDHPLSPNAASHSPGDQDDGLIELSAADLANQRRKFAVASEPRAAIQTRLEQLTDIPVIRITESLFRELLVQYGNSATAAPQQTGQPANDADDGLIELIAADSGAFSARHSATPSSDHSQPVAVESGIALYQTLEVAGLDDIAEVAAAVHSQAAPVAPTEQIAKAE